MGLYKLVLARNMENGALEESHFDEKYIEALVTEFKGEEFIAMDTKYSVSYTHQMCIRDSSNALNCCS